MPNPAYIGEWKAKEIPNPVFFSDDALHRLGGVSIGALAVEIWTMSANMLFSNFLVTRDVDAAAAFAAATWSVKNAAQVAANAAAATPAPVTEEGETGALSLESLVDAAEDAWAWVMASPSNTGAAVVAAVIAIAVLSRLISPAPAAAKKAGRAAAAAVEAAPAAAPAVEEKSEESGADKAAGTGVRRRGRRAE